MSIVEKSYSFMLHTNIPIKPKAGENCGWESDLANIVKSQFGWLNRF